MNTVDERLTSLKENLLHVTKQVCVSSKHPRKKQMCLKNVVVEKVVKEKRWGFRGSID